MQQCTQAFYRAFHYAYGMSHRRRNQGDKDMCPLPVFTTVSLLIDSLCTKETVISLKSKKAVFNPNSTHKSKFISLNCCSLRNQSKRNQLAALTSG